MTTIKIVVVIVVVTVAAVAVTTMVILVRLIVVIIYSVKQDSLYCPSQALTNSLKEKKMEMPPSTNPK